MHVHICLRWICVWEVEGRLFPARFSWSYLWRKAPSRCDSQCEEISGKHHTERYLYIFTIQSSLRLKAWVNDVIGRLGVGWWWGKWRGELVTDFPLFPICLRSGTPPPPPLQDICSTLWNMNIKCCVFLLPFLQFVQPTWTSVDYGMLACLIKAVITTQGRAHLG